jgi:hypothetical protein
MKKVLAAVLIGAGAALVIGDPEGPPMWVTGAVLFVWGLRLNQERDR